MNRDAILIGLATALFYLALIAPGSRTPKNICKCGVACECRDDVRQP